MLAIHKRIIKEVLQEKKRDPKVIAILLFGSIARGAAHELSDIDIEIIYLGERYKTKEEKRYGIKVDYEFWPKKKLAKRFKKYPFLSYPYLSEKILYDKTGFLKKFKAKVKTYFKENPEVLKEWQKWEKNYLAAKKKGKKILDVDEFYSSLKKKFS